MAMDLYSIIITEMGPNPKKLRKTFEKDGKNDSEIDAIFEKLENGENVVLDGYYLLRDVDGIKEKYQECGAVVIHELARKKEEIEKQRAKEAGAKKGDTTDYTDLAEGWRRYSAVKEDLWKYLIFCMIGWPVFAVGVCLTMFEVWIGILLIIAGIVIVDIPSFKLLAAGYGLAGLFAVSGAVYEITYSDGSKRYDYSEKHAGAAMAFITYALVAFIGILVMVFRILRLLFMAASIKRKFKLELTFKETVLFPTTFALGVFAVFLIAIIICSIIAEYQRIHHDDLNDKETFDLLVDMEETIETASYSYMFYDYDDTRVDFVYVKHQVVDNAEIYIVEVTESGAKKLKIPEGIYGSENGKWFSLDQNGNVVKEVAKYKETLEKYTLDDIMGLTDLQANVSKLNVIKSDVDSQVYSIYYHKKNPNTKYTFVNLNRSLEVTFVSGIRSNDLMGAVTVYDGLDFGGMINK